MDIGTAKPSVPQRRGVPHWGLDLVLPNERFSVGDYLRYAYAKVTEILSRGCRVLVVGGSGFYLKSFFAPVVDDLSNLDRAVLQVQRWQESHGEAFLINQLLERAGGSLPSWLDIHNPTKVRNALARCCATGMSLDELRGNFVSQVSVFDRFDKEIFWRIRPLEILKARASDRIDRMLTNGLVDEVRGLMQRNLLLEHTPPARSVGYSEVMKFLTGGGSPSDDLGILKQTILTHTLHLIKKQHTWFRSQLPRFCRLHYVV
jgi:tRNA dimethylallyltransferase